MIKKRHVFYIIYVLVMFACMVTSLVLNPMARTTMPEYNNNDIVFGVSSTLLGDIMLLISTALLAGAIIFLIIRKIYTCIHKISDKNRKK